MTVEWPWLGQVAEWLMSDAGATPPPLTLSTGFARVSNTPTGAATPVNALPAEAGWRVN